VPAEDLRTRFPMLDADSGVAETFAANLGEDSPGVFDLDRIKVPAGGGTAWEVPTLDGIDHRRVLTGVIIAVIARRAFWQAGLDDSDSSGSPPDCASDDAKIGRGLYGAGSKLHPQGDCASCPMNAFRDVRGRRTKPCKEQRLMLFLLEGSMLPVVMQFAPTSMQSMKTYLTRLAQHNVPYYRAITNLALRKVDASPPFSVAEATIGGQLDSESAAQLRSMGDQVKAAYLAMAAANAAPLYDEDYTDTTAEPASKG
jgi:hypothetical protein